MEIHIKFFYWVIEMIFSDTKVEDHLGLDVLKR